MMALERTSVKKRKEILAMKAEGASVRNTSRCLRVCHKTVRKVYEADNQSDSESKPQPIISKYDHLDWAQIKAEISERNTPVKTLWQELQDTQQLDVNYKAFWREVHRRLPQPQVVTLRKIYNPGEKAEVDFAQGLYVPFKGKKKRTELVVMALPLSSYFYAEFVWSQDLPTFIAFHERAFRFFGGVTKYLVCDNLKAGVTKAHRYDPQVNQTFQDFSHHMNFRVLPARVRKPQDKGCVERNIGVIQQQFYPRVRDRRLKSIQELNRALSDYMKTILHAEMKDRGCSRYDGFQYEKSYLLPLPQSSFVLPIYKMAKVHMDCHIQFQRNFYSVPHTYVQQTLKVRLIDNTLEIFDKDGESVASHIKMSGRGKRSTCKGHYPKHAEALENYTVKQAFLVAEKIGPHTQKLVEKLLNTSHPLQYLRRVQGILRAYKLDPATDTMSCEKGDMEHAASLCLHYKKHTYPFFMDCLKEAKAARNESSSGAPKRDIRVTFLDDLSLQGDDND